MIKRGATRTVILIGKYAIKTPSIFAWRLFLLGLLANMQEAIFSKTGWPELCPVLFSFPGGFLVVMRRARPISRTHYESISYEQLVAKDHYRVPAENKPDSWGVLDGRIVAVDYGS